MEEYNENENDSNFAWYHWTNYTFWNELWKVNYLHPNGETYNVRSTYDTIMRSVGINGHTRESIDNQIKKEMYLADYSNGVGGLTNQELGDIFMEIDAAITYDKINEVDLKNEIDNDIVNKKDFRKIFVETEKETVIDNGNYHTTAIGQVDKFFETIFRLVKTLLKLVETITDMEELLTLIPYFAVLYVLLKVIKSIV